MTRYATTLLVAAVAACSTGGSSPTDSGFPSGSPAPSGESLVVRVGESATVPGTAVTIHFLRVTEDSRCAQDVVCVWAGNARVELRLSRSSDSRDAALNTTLEPREAEFGGLRIALGALEPYPLSSSPTDPDGYVATFEVQDD